jgi:hypothetical protein
MTDERRTLGDILADFDKVWSDIKHHLRKLNALAEHEHAAPDDLSRKLQTTDGF